MLSKLPIVLILIGSSVSAFAEDVLIAIGGGPNPMSNQVSLESNIHFFDRTLRSTDAKLETVECYFADGKIAKRDLQYIDPDVDHDEASTWMSTLFGDKDDMSMTYRNSVVPNLAGPSRKARLQQRFMELADRLKSGDRCVIYVTTHGGPAETDSYDYDYDYGGSESNKFNTTIALWNDEELTASEFSGWLDRFHRDVEFVLIMTQCYSGGFARTIFHDADPKRGLGRGKRCGFFSQRYDRPSTGCTPLVDESTYRDYGTYFWEAIGGKSRIGDDVDDCDFDEDGKVSFAEAHCHALITAESMDVPVRTSDVLVRKFSRLGVVDEEEETKSESPGGLLGALFGGGQKQKAEKETADEATDGEERGGGEELLTNQASIKQCLAMAFAEEAAVIQTLREELELEPETTLEQVHQRAKRLKKKMVETEATMSQNWLLQFGYTTEIRSAVSREYPELNQDSFHPLMFSILNDAEQAKKFIQFINDYTVTDAYHEAVKKSDKLEEKSLRAESRFAKASRLDRTMESILLRANLPKIASPDRLKSFETMLAMERSSIER